MNGHEEHEKYKSSKETVSFAHKMIDKGTSFFSFLS
jgi:hypothetical protein